MLNQIDLQYTPVTTMNSEMRTLCFIFPMSIEAAPFLERVEVIREWSSGKAWRREAFFEGRRLLIVKC